MANRDIVDPVLTLSQGLDDRVDAVADDPEHVSCAPVNQRLDQDVRGRHIGAVHRRRLLHDVGFRFRGLSGRCGAWGGGCQAGRGGGLEKITTIPTGGFVAAHRTCPSHRPVAPSLNSMVSSRFNSDLGRDRFGRQAFTPLCRLPDKAHPRQIAASSARDTPCGDFTKQDSRSRTARSRLRAAAADNERHPPNSISRAPSD